jgi:hypothetical protein
MKIFDVIDVPQPEDCKKCTPCLRLRMMEMGFISGQRIEISDKKLGLWLVNILSDNDSVDSQQVIKNFLMELEKFLNEENLNENEIKLGHALYDLFNDYEKINNTELPTH